MKNDVRDFVRHEEGGKETGDGEPQPATVGQVDCREMLRPMPLLMAMRALRGLSPGKPVQLVCSDPGVVQDFDAYAKVSGHGVEYGLDLSGDVLVILRHK